MDLILHHEFRYMVKRGRHAWIGPYGAVSVNTSKTFPAVWIAHKDPGPLRLNESREGVEEDKNSTYEIIK